MSVTSIQARPTEGAAHVVHLSIQRQTHKGTRLDYRLTASEIMASWGPSIYRQSEVVEGLKQLLDTGVIALDVDPKRVRKGSGWKLLILTTDEGYHYRPPTDIGGTLADTAPMSSDTTPMATDIGRGPVEAHASPDIVPGQREVSSSSTLRLTKALKVLEGEHHLLDLAEGSSWSRTAEATSGGRSKGYKLLALGDEWRGLPGPKVPVPTPHLVSGDQIKKRRGRVMDPDGPAGLARYFGDKVVQAGLGWPGGVTSLMNPFSKMLGGGMDADEIRVMVNLFVADPDRIRRSKKLPWVQFLGRYMALRNQASKHGHLETREHDVDWLGLKTLNEPRPKIDWLGDGVLR